jgi:uncharacterized protein with ParB-like and HNH nuclease domain
MPTDISPDKQTINDVFGATNYHIGFYQRDYKWQSEQVQTLLDDLFHVFTPAYANFQDRQPNSETINEFPWYYLSTYVTSDAGGKTYVVDGQQRLTTLTLMLIRLYKLAEQRNMGDMAKCVEEKILGHTLDGKNYYIGHGKRAEPLRAIFENEGEDFNVGQDVTAKNMLKNYGLIQAELDERLSDGHSLQMFIRFLLQRVVLIQLSVKQRTDVPMVFEVINDRGVSLNPHEILKGKLLSRIDRNEVEPFVHTWEAHVGALDYEDMADEFFETYLRSRFAETRDEGQRFRGNYHRLMFEPDYGSELNLTETANAKDFVSAEVPYFSGLYQELHDLADKFDPNFPHVRYNDLTGMDSQYMLVLAACSRDDAQKEEKIRVVSRELDRLYVLLQLNKAYDSNTFADSMYGIRTELAEADTGDYPPKGLPHGPLVSAVPDLRIGDTKAWGRLSRCGDKVTRLVSFRGFRERTCSKSWKRESGAS